MKEFKDNKKKTWSVLFLIPLVLLACNKNGTNVTYDDLTIEVLDDSIRVTNNTSLTIHYLAVERGTAAVIDWAPSCDTQDSNQIVPGHSTQILYENIFGFHEDCEILFYWWTCYNSRSPGLSPGPLHVEIIKIQ